MCCDYVVWTVSEPPDLYESWKASSKFMYKRKYCKYSADVWRVWTMMKCCIIWLGWVVTGISLTCRIVCVPFVLIYDVNILPSGRLNLFLARISFLSSDLLNDAISTKHHCGDEMEEYKMDWKFSTRGSNTDKISVSKYVDELVILKRFLNKYGLRAWTDQLTQDNLVWSPTCCTNSYLFTYNAFIKILYTFRTLPCSSSGGLRRNCIYAASGIVTLCRWLSCAPVKKEFFLNRCTRHSPADGDDTRGCIYTITT